MSAVVFGRKGIFVGEGFWTEGGFCWRGLLAGGGFLPKGGFSRRGIWQEGGFVIDPIHTYLRNFGRRGGIWQEGGFVIDPIHTYYGLFASNSCTCTTFSVSHTYKSTCVFTCMH